MRFTDIYARMAAELIERRRTEEALRISEERFRQYFDLGLIGMAITSVEKDCLEVNDELCRILGYERRELLGMLWTDITHPDDVDADLAQFQRVLVGEIDGYTLDKRWVRKDGCIIHTVMAAQCVRRSDRSVDYFISLVRDTTERRRAEDALSRLQSELMHVARVATLGELAASIAHDVNQPLTAIITNGHACMRWLGHEMPNIGEATEAAERIVRDAKLAAGIITRIREFLKRGAIQVGPTDLIGAISEVVAMVDAQIRRDSVLLQIVSAEKLPLVAADRIQLQQVILNLVMNALDAMTESRVARVLQIELLSHGADAVHVAVRDSGIGLNKEHRDRAFDAFHTTKPHGMGMGLAISRSIVEAHGGQLWATPNDNYGETFHFTVPVAAQ
jgi:PAS domain S-box-containing protein